MGIRIPLIPQGFTIRDYVNLTLMITAYYHRDKGLDVKCSNGCVEFTGDIDDICLSFSTAYQRILDVINTKLKQNISCPQLHFNDRNVLVKVFSKLGLPKPRKDAKYIDVFYDIIKYFRKELEDTEKCMQFVEEVSTLTFTRDKILILGSKSARNTNTFAPLQPFKVEKYEYGKDFLDLTKSKMDVKASPSWISLIASGWMLAYNGFINGALLFAMPPSYMVDASICSEEYTRIIMNALGVSSPVDAFNPDKRGYYTTPLRVRTLTNPVEAYYLLIALESPPLRDPSRTPLRLVRIRFDGKAFTMLEDVVVDLSRLKEFAELTATSKRLRRAVEALAKCAIQSYSGVVSDWCRAMFGDNAVRMVKALYNAITGSYDRLYTVYLLSRLSPQPNNVTPFFRDPWIISDLLRALGVSIP